MLEKPIQVVDITNPTLQSILGNYFIGQTEEMAIAGNNHGWAALKNPIHSGVNLFFDIFTITNYWGTPITAEIWLNPKLPGLGMPTPYVTPANLTISPPPKPKVKLLFASPVPGRPTGGINVFDRIVTPYSTLVSDSSKGGIILGPGDVFAVFLRPQGEQKIPVRVVFSWWEEKVQN
ncbi:DUF6143 family protein [Heliophilum fasciatum]|uniref:Uncharacterized protein n=1 Tax=Heliophilum fasciatum TaxID=35700 RepID=A0A4R2RA09_9FIRM|nr:DUF6143 family protein [Heliophilum fasciatum]MCW2279397.1 hypothetical protein [Heliophilum fasciatum]TCP60090.1 hypothetical protein EDD73_1425 [Heliophilum fasciatum]